MFPRGPYHNSSIPLDVVHILWTPMGSKLISAAIVHKHCLEADGTQRSKKFPWQSLEVG
jgi:hypothetical protein